MMDAARQQRIVGIARWQVAQAEQRLSGQYARVSWLGSTGRNRDLLIAATRMLDTFEETLDAMRRHLEIAEAWTARASRAGCAIPRAPRVMAGPNPNAAIRTSDHIALLYRVLEHYGLSDDCLEIVPNVYAWSWQQGIPETTWLRQAKCIDLGDGRCVIAVRSKLYDSMISARRVALELLGLRVAVLDDLGSQGSPGVAGAARRRSRQQCEIHRAAPAS
jgi:hypothetical protein